ncbi:MAG: stage II sporulation protein P [Oscillospiraceae bacterium]
MSNSVYYYPAPPNMLIKKEEKNMGKIKSIIIVCLAICCPFLAGSQTAAGGYIREAALLTAGAELHTSDTDKQDTDSSPEPPASSTPEQSASSSTEESRSQNSISTASTTSTSSSEDIPANNPVTPQQKRGTVIVQNRSEQRDTTDFSQFTEHSGAIIRCNFGKFTSEAYINLESGAQVRNCTDVLNSTLENAAVKTPELDINTDEPSVLIYHTHTSESFLPEADWYDKNYPLRSSDPERSIVAVGDAICEALAERGISSVHDCTIHDDPYTGSYYRSAETIQKTLEKYPSIKVVIDVHRDGIGNGDGSLPAPVAMIDGKNAAQFMIISCCESEMFDMPYYLENFKLACLIQNCAEERYPSLARPILFDYRNYNQSLSTGALLIEVGSHGNSLEEAVYSGQLVGNAIADAIYRIAG